MTISDIVQSVYRRTNTNSTSYPAADMLISINTAYERVSSLIMQADDRWQWDDTNATDLPIATTGMVSGQQDYTLAASHLTIDRVEIKDITGNWTELNPIDQHDVKHEALEAHLGTTTGIPIEYDKVGSSIFLYPSPNYTQAASLKIYFTRGPSEFTSGDVSTGTKQPGFAILFHDLIPLWVAYDYAIPNGLASANGFFASILRKEQEIVDFYGGRSRDERPRMSVASGTYKTSASGRLYTMGGDSNK